MTTKPDTMTTPIRFAREPARPVFDPLPLGALTRGALGDLVNMHTYRRAAGSKGEAQFIARFVDSIPGITRDKHGNRHIRIGDSPIVWSSHTDSVHDVKESKHTPRQRLAYGDGMLTLHHEEKASCLGADCAAGVWLMREMIARGVQGWFVFHAAEEIGGIGSARFVEDNGDALRDMVACIAFDRRGTSSIITHQGGRTCSDAFAESLGAMLGERFVLDDTGTFTDSANYAEHVAECSNVSVGYHGAHTPQESLDVTYCAWLLERLCELDASRLVVARDPAARETSWASYYGTEREESLEDLVAENPVTAADMLRELGVDAESFLAFQREQEDARWARFCARFGRKRG